MTVPPFCRMPPTAFQVIGRIIVTAIDEALIAFVDGKDFGAAIEPSPYHGAQRCIHTLCITAACQDANAFHCP